MSDEVVETPTEETTPTLEELADAVNTLTESITTLNILIVCVPGVIFGFHYC